MRLAAVFAVFSVALVAKEATNWVRRDQQPVSLRMPFIEYPTGIAGEGWIERREELDERTLGNAGVSDYLNHFYESRDASLWFYCGYYDGRRLESIHQPEVCFPGTGWEVEAKSIESLSIDAERSGLFNVLVFRRGEERRLTAYSFYYEGRFEPDQGSVEWGRVLGDRHFAIITLSTTVSQSTSSSRDIIGALVKRLVPPLVDHIPLEESHTEASA